MISRLDARLSSFYQIVARSFHSLEALGCLALSKLIDMPAPSTTEDDSGDWDGDEGRQTAFCNSVNVRMEKVS